MLSYVSGQGIENCVILFHTILDMVGRFFHVDVCCVASILVMVKVEDVEASDNAVVIGGEEMRESTLLHRRNVF
jgi:hypothetical protein